MRGGSGYYFTGPVIPFAAMVKYPPISAERHIEITSICYKSLARYIFLICMDRGVNLKRRHSNRRR